MSVPQEMRYTSLDGLRGVASLVVVGYHALLIVPAVSALYVQHTNPGVLTPEWWLYATPLRLFFAGHEAVLTFFVLSGFVLALPFLTAPLTGRSALAYYGRRVVRLYLPVWASLLFAYALALLIPRHPGETWLGSHHPPTPANLWHDGILLFGTSNLNSPLWSLTWEVWFSLLMPLMFLAIRVTRAHRWWWAAIPILMLVSAAARFPVVRHALPAAWVTDDLLQYIPIFAIGMLLAFNRQRILAAAAHVTVWWPIIVCALLFTVSPSVLAPNGWGTAQAGWYLLSLVGVTLLVALAFGSPLAGSLDARPVQWAGRRSFSIYLVHEPILVGAALLVGASGWDWLLLVPLVVLIVLLTAEGFYRAVEHPTIGLSRRVGRAIGGRRSPTTGTADRPAASVPIT